MTSYVADAPISNPAEDRFSRWPFAKRIADTIASRLDPSSLVIAIYGAWGDGKTTVLNFVAKELSEQEDVVVICFNPWRFPDEAALLRSFFATLAKALGTKLSTGKEDLGKALAKYGKFLDVVKSGVGGALKDAGELLGGIDIEEEKRRVEQILSENKKRAVILMDDIDRLEKGEIQAVFKLVKLTGDFENVSYVLAFDSEMVANAIGERFTSIEDERAQAGHSFLEKIVQVPLDLPSIPRDALGQFAFEAIGEALQTVDIRLTESQFNDFAQTFSDGIGTRLKTPRMAKRYANSITFALGINKGEVHEVDQMLIEGIRVFFPHAYAVIKQNRQAFTAIKDGILKQKDISARCSQIKAEIEKGLHPDEAKALLKLLNSLFPRFGETLYDASWDEEWGKSQRAASPAYFDRYFTYSVSGADIADGSVTSLLAGLESSSIEEITLKLKELINPSNVEIVIFKLRTKAEEVSPNSARNLVIAIAMVGNLFPYTETFFYPTDPANRAAMLVSKLLKQIEPPNRYYVAEALSCEAEPLPFACRIVRWITSGKDTPPEDRRLTPDEDVALLQKLAARIEGYVLNRGKLIFESPRDAKLYLEFWARAGKEKEVQQFLAKDFEQNPSDAIIFISGFLPTSYSASGSKPSNFERSNYEQVARLIAPALLHECMVKLFGDEISTPVYNGPLNRSLAESIAHQFEYVRNAVIAEAEAQPSQSASEGLAAS